MLRPTLSANLLRVTTPSPGQGAPAASSISSAGHGRPAICRAEQDIRRHEPACRFCLWGHGLVRRRRSIPVRRGVLGARPKSAPKPGPGNLSRSNEATGVGWNNPSGNVSLRLGPIFATPHSPRTPLSHRACHSGLDPESIYCRIGRLSEGMLRPTLVAKLLRVTTPSPGQGAPAAAPLGTPAARECPRPQRQNRASPVSLGTKRPVSTSDRPDVLSGQI